MAFDYTVDGSSVIGSQRTTWGTFTNTGGGTGGIGMEYQAPAPLDHVVRRLPADKQRDGGAAGKGSRPHLAFPHAAAADGCRGAT